MSAALAYVAKARRIPPSTRRMRDRAERQFANDFRAAVKALSAALVPSRIAWALRYGLEAAMREIPLDEAFVPRLRALYQRQFRDLFEASGDEAYARFAVRKKADPPGFAILDDRPLEWLRRASAERVTNIAAETREGIRAALAAGMIAGQGAAKIARELRPKVGLIPKHVDSVLNFAAELRDVGRLTSPTPMQRAMFPGLVGNEKPLASSYIEYATRRYADALLRWRTETIARTEVQTALSHGQDQAFRQMVDEGLVEPDVKRIWVIAHDEITCEICAPLDGEEAPIGGLFAGEYDMPPAHPNCRCDVTLDY